jgi:biopolymer transport protein ExbB
LGTVQSIILAFGRIKTGGDPTALAGDIGIGLICTFGGLIVGILTMSTFYFFSNHVRQLGQLVEKIVVELFEEVPFQELQGVKFGTELEEDLQTSGASPTPRSAPAPMRKPQVAAVTPLAVPAVAVAPASIGPSGQTGKVTMVACPTCGTLILPRSKQCPNCKTELEWD